MSSEEGNVLKLLKLLGKLGARLPRLKCAEWETVFEFLDYYMIVRDDKPPQYVDFDWVKVKEILMLLDKVE